MTKEIILASQSPRRKQLLEQAEITFRIEAANVDETFPDNISVTDAPICIAKNKALIIAAKNKDAIVIAADTVVILDDTIIGKPNDRDDAIAILQRLCGRMHTVITGVVIICNEKITELSDTTEVYFKHLTKEKITYYVDKYQPYDKAGAYAIQEWIGLIGIEKINGDYYNVMGLPVNRVVHAIGAFA